MNGIQMVLNGDGILTPLVGNDGMKVGDTLQQNQALILMLHKGELKENPAVGVGISDMLLDDDPLYWRTAIREQMEMDGQTVNTIKVTRKGIEIKADY